VLGGILALAVTSSVTIEHVAGGKSIISNLTRSDLAGRDMNPHKFPSFDIIALMFIVRHLKQNF